MSERKIAYYVKIKRQCMSLQAKGNDIGVTEILSNLFNTSVYYELPECSLEKMELKWAIYRFK